MSSGKKILVVGGGGREHALAWKIAQSPKIGKIYAAPGNAGMAAMGVECLPYEAYNADNIENIKNLAKFAEGNVDLTVIGPENPLALGIVDTFDGMHLPIVGPTKAAARLEASKAFTKRLMKKYGIPTADYQVFNDPADAERFIRENWRPDRKWVVKASGLALGKGVTVTDSMDEALYAVTRAMVNKEFHDAGDEVVVEERLYGPEASLIALVDSFSELFLPPAQDYKPVGDGDKGKNTGGMGSYSPVPAMTRSLLGDSQGMVRKTLNAMEECGIQFRGIAYAALILTEDGPQILEYNVRFGDPETQPLVMRLRSDILPYLEACASDILAAKGPFEIDHKAAVGVVLASEGYPGKYDKGKLITGLEDVKSNFPRQDVVVFHAGTKVGDDRKFYTNGGRVLCVTALGDTLDEAADKAYAAAGMINFEGKYCRTDIGRNVLERGRVQS